MQYYDVFINSPVIDCINVRAKNMKAAVEEVKRMYREEKTTDKYIEPVIYFVERVNKAGHSVYHVRKCNHCHNSMREGYCIDGGIEYYCSDACLYTNFTPEEWEEIAAEDGDSYWTEWK